MHSFFQAFRLPKELIVAAFHGAHAPTNCSNAYILLCISEVSRQLDRHGVLARPISNWTQLLRAANVYMRKFSIGGFNLLGIEDSDRGVVTPSARTTIR